MRKLVAAVGVFVSLANADVRAQGALDAEMHVDDLVWAARACYLEASFRKHDCLAILHVAKKRADRVGRFWVDVLTQYSALGANNPRAREVREYPWSDIEGKPAAFNRRWRLLRALVVEFASGQHTDPASRPLRTRFTRWANRRRGCNLSCGRVVVGVTLGSSYRPLRGRLRLSQSRFRRLETRAEAPPSRDPQKCGRLLPWAAANTDVCAHPGRGVLVLRVPGR